MLFSDNKVATYINDQFEPTWKSLRQVPRVTIDFGDRKKIERTLHGNIATYVCTADGAVVDVLPGIYSAEAYTRELKVAHGVAERAGRMTSKDRKIFLAKYHSRLELYAPVGGNVVAAGSAGSAGETGELAKGASAPETVHAMTTRPDVSKRVIEAPTKSLLQLSAPALGPVTSFESAAKLTTAKLEGLSEDVLINESARRKRIHAYLASAGLVQPKDMNQWLYKEILHADLNDPYLGLKEYLDKPYPLGW